MMKKIAISGGLLLALALGIGAGLWLAPTPEPITITRTEYTPVEVVREIPGPPEVVERIVTQTREVEVPVERTREILVTEPCPDGSTPEPAPLEAYVAIEAEQYEGRTEAGKYERGWFGFATCYARPTGGEEWIKLVDEPFEIEETRVVSELGASSTFSAHQSLGFDVLAGTDGFGGQVEYGRLLYRTRTSRSELWGEVGVGINPSSEPQLSLGLRYQW